MGDLRQGGHDYSKRGYKLIVAAALSLSGRLDALAPPAPEFPSHPEISIDYSLSGSSEKALWEAKGEVPGGSSATRKLFSGMLSAS
jgi:hypothetical protein